MQSGKTLCTWRHLGHFEAAVCCVDRIVPLALYSVKSSALRGTRRLSVMHTCASQSFPHRSPHGRLLKPIPSGCQQDWIAQAEFLHAEVHPLQGKYGLFGVFAKNRRISPKSQRASERLTGILSRAQSMARRMMMDSGRNFSSETVCCRAEKRTFDDVLLEVMYAPRAPMLLDRNANA